MLKKLSFALKKTREKISAKLGKIYQKGYSKEDLLSLEEELLSIDVGAAATEKIIKSLSKGLHIKDILADILKNSQSRIEDDIEVLVLVGVNGNGKTTTIGKLSSLFSQRGKSTLIAACDTYRAAAQQQLEIWADRANAKFFSIPEIKSPSAICYKALEEESHDMVMVDTAGRLASQYNLMEEINKIIRICREKKKTKVLQIIEANTGQSCLDQIEKFIKHASIDGLIISKLDLTNKAGIIISIAYKYNIPIYFLGTGEKMEDIVEYSIDEFVDSII